MLPASASAGEGTESRGFGPRVVLCCSYRQAMPGGGSFGVKASGVKPSSEEAQRVSERRASGHRGVSRDASSKAPLRRSCTVEASWRVKSRVPLRGRGGSGLGRSGCRRVYGLGGEAEATGRQRYGRKTSHEGRQGPKVTSGPPKRGVSPQTRRFTGERGEQSRSEPVATRDGVLTSFEN